MSRHTTGDHHPFKSITGYIFRWVCVLRPRKRSKLMWKADERVYQKMDLTPDEINTFNALMNDPTVRKQTYGIHSCCAFPNVDASVLYTCEPNVTDKNTTQNEGDILPDRISEDQLIVMAELLRLHAAAEDREIYPTTTGSLALSKRTTLPAMEPTIGGVSIRTKIKSNSKDSSTVTIKWPRADANPSYESSVVLIQYLCSNPDITELLISPIVYEHRFSQKSQILDFKANADTYVLPKLTSLRVLVPSSNLTNMLESCGTNLTVLSFVTNRVQLDTSKDSEIKGDVALSKLTDLQMIVTDVYPSEEDIKANYASHEWVPARLPLLQTIVWTAKKLQHIRIDISERTHIVSTNRNTQSAHLRSFLESVYAMVNDRAFDMKSFILTVDDEVDNPKIAYFFAKIKKMHIPFVRECLSKTKLSQSNFYSEVKSAAINHTNIPNRQHYLHRAFWMITSNVFEQWDTLFVTENNHFTVYQRPVTESTD